MTWEYVFIRIADLYAMILVVYICLTWIPTRQGVFGDVMNFLEKICEPYLKLFRSLIPPIGGMIDITPIIALLVLQFGARLIVSIF
jgi:YggT family protein